MGLDVSIMFLDNNGNAMDGDYFQHPYVFDTEKIFNREWKHFCSRFSQLKHDSCWASLETSDVKSVINFIERICRKNEKQIKYFKSEMKRQKKDWFYFQGFTRWERDIPFMVKNINYTKKLKEDILSYKPSSLLVSMNW